MLNGQPQAATERKETHLMNLNEQFLKENETLHTQLNKLSGLVENLQATHATDKAAGNPSPTPFSEGYLQTYHNHIANYSIMNERLKGIISKLSESI